MDISAVRNLNTFYGKKHSGTGFKQRSARGRTDCRKTRYSPRHEQKLPSEELAKPEQAEVRVTARPPQTVSEEDLFRLSGAPVDQYDTPALLRRRRKS